MSYWRRLLRRFARLADQDLDRELRAHLELEAEEQQESGLPPDEARYAARRAFGNVTLVKEDTRAVWGWGWFERLMQDLKYSFRLASKNPGFTAAATLTLALGIGANTAIFSAVHGVLMRPLPVEELDRIFVLQSDAPGLNLRRFPLNPESAFRLNERRDLFEAVGGHRNDDLIMTGFGEPQLVRGGRTAGDLFHVLRARPYLGRLYGSNASEPGRHYIAVVSYGFWRRVGGGAVDFLGRKIMLNGHPHEVIGVLPPGFEYPAGVEIWLPMPANDPAWRPASVLVTLARLRPGVTLPMAEVELRTYAKSWGTPEGWGMTIVTQPFIEYLAGRLRPALLVLMAAVGIVLLIACTNVASLQLVRATARAREMAVRTALGAGRWTLVRQSLVESLSIALTGGAAGVVLSYLMIDGLRAWQPEAFPQLAGLRLNRSVLTFAAVASLLAGICVGLVPSLRSAGTDLVSALRASGRAAGADRARHRLLSGFAATQFASAFILLAGSMLLVRSFSELLKANPGFNPERLVSMSLSLPAERYPNPASVVAFYKELQSRLNGIPGIESMALTSNLPLSENMGSSPFQIVHRSTAPHEPQPHAERLNVSPEYFRLLRVPLLRGRNFEPADALPAHPVALIDAQLARQFFESEDPIGKQIRHNGPIATIIGVVGSTSQKEVGGAPKATVYYFIEQYPRNPVTLVLRTSLDIAIAARFVRGIVSQIDPGIPVASVRTVQQLINNSLGTRQLAMYVLSAFAALSLILAVLGIYGVLSFITRERTQEIGVRLALGARPGEVTTMILRRGALLTGLGLALGIAGSIMVTRFLSALLYGVSPRDPLTLGFSMAILILAGLAASWLPARRASRVDPMAALRHE